MTRATAFIVAPAAALALAGCSNTPKHAEPDRPPVAYQQVPGDPVIGVMHAKLDHAEAILGGLAESNFKTIEYHARQLERLSREASFLVSDSVTYVLYSDQFREVVRDMAEHAGHENLELATLDYMQTVQLCVACHTYMRRERIAGDFPQRVTLAPPPDATPSGG